MRTIAAGVFKAQCLSLMDEVEAKREAILITKWGKPVARLVPIELEPAKDPIFGLLRDKATLTGDPDDWVKPIVANEDWRDTWDPRE